MFSQAIAGEKGNEGYKAMENHLKRQRQFERRLEQQNIEANVRMEQQRNEMYSRYIEILEKKTAEQAQSSNASSTPASESSETVDNERIQAYHVSTLDTSIAAVKVVSVEDIVLQNIFNALFFAKPVELLRKLAVVKEAMKWADVQRVATISRDGTPGADGISGRHGVSGADGGGNGSDGNNGGDAQSGSDAKDVIVSLMSVPQQNIFLVTPEFSAPVILPLFDPSVKINLTAIGGAGGDGGSGGKGGRGGDGFDGKDATRSSSGTSGTNGGNGYDLTPTHRITK